MAFFSEIKKKCLKWLCIGNTGLTMQSKDAMNVYTHLGFDDAKDEMVRLEELEAAKKEVEKVTGEKPVSQKMFKAI